ncbi:MAG: hypothetical protein IV107_16430 [Paucibacter sp.]|nr:hypothetical protein [Roseateles sp.]
MRTTHTYAALEVSPATHHEIEKLLRAAGYDHAFDDGEGAIDMHGIGLVKRPQVDGNVSVRGATIQTANGHYFDYLTSNAGYVDIETVAHALSNICRFTGHCVEFYSVAQHCVLMSYYAVPQQHAFWALMHEAGEPWVGDMNKPLKLLLPEYDRIESPAERATLIHFGLDPDAKPATIKPGDHVMLATEQRDLMPKKRATGWDGWGIANAWEPLPTQHWTELAGIVPLERCIRPWTPAQAKSAFLQRYRELAFGAGGLQEGTLIRRQAVPA